MLVNWTEMSYYKYRVLSQHDRLSYEYECDIDIYENDEDLEEGEGE